MAAPFSLKIDASMTKLDRRLTKLEKNIYPRAVVAAINKTARKVVSLSIKSSARQLSIPPKVLRSRIYLSKASQATRKKPWATVRVRIRPINAASLMTPSRRETMIKKTHGPHKKRPNPVKAGRRYHYTNAFVGKGRGNNTLILNRKTAASDSKLVAHHVKHKHVTWAKVRRFGKNPRIFRNEFRKQMKRFGVN